MARHAGAALGLLFLAHAEAEQFTDQGSKLVGTGALGLANQGTSIAISADGGAGIVGGPNDSSSAGAGWVFVARGCEAPSVTGHAQNQTIQSGQATTLLATVTGTTPLSYQWHQGNAGDTAMQVGVDASTFTTPHLESTASYWVRVTNACGTADSAAAVITVRRGPRRHLHRAT